MKAFIITLLVAFTAIVSAVYIVNRIELEQSCLGRLKRAANANSTELAKEELFHALNYMEDNNLTTGYTSVFYKTPDEDIGYWYRNIKTAWADINNLPENSSQMEQSNVLMKLRETLLDHGEKGDKLVYPKGLVFYPNNLLWGIARIAAFICVMLFMFMLNLFVK